MLGKSVYAYVWRISRKDQIKVCGLVGLVAFLSVLPLELQRRIVDSVVSHPDLRLMALLGSVYLAVLVTQGGLKYLVNVLKGRVQETVARDLRRRTVERRCAQAAAGNAPGSEPINSGTMASMLTSESEDLGEFASSSLSTPLLQSTTIVWVLAYLIWVEPLIAALAVVVYAPQILLVPKIQHNVNRLARRRTQVMRRLGHEAVDFENTSTTAQQRLGVRAGHLINLIFKIRMIIYRQKYFLTILGNFLNSFGILVVLMAGGYMVIRGDTEVSTLVVFMSGFQKISDPWDQLIQFYRAVSNARVSFGLIAEVFDGTAVSGTSAGGGKPGNSGDSILN
jgi:ABC-type multidrug transport system fused ATPase/permease subunit